MVGIAGYVRRHHLALVALFLALGGSSYAALGAKSVIHASYGSSGQSGVGTKWSKVVDLKPKAYQISRPGGPIHSNLPTRLLAHAVVEISLVGGSPSDAVGANCRLIVNPGRRNALQIGNSYGLTLHPGDYELISLTGGIDRPPGTYNVDVECKADAVRVQPIIVLGSDLTVTATGR